MVADTEYIATYEVGKRVSSRESCVTGYENPLIHKKIIVSGSASSARVRAETLGLSGVRSIYGSRKKVRLADVNPSESLDEKVSSVD